MKTKKQVIVSNQNMAAYFRLRQKGYITVWAGEGRICLEKRGKTIKQPD